MIDRVQLGRWFDAHAGALLLVARQWLDRAAAEDVVQDVFVSLMAQRRPPDHLKAWLFKAARNAAISRARSAGRRARREMRLAAERPDWFEPAVADLIDAAAAQAALERLAPEHREVIVMRIWARMTLAEIGQVTGEAMSTLFSRYRAGLIEIKRIMESSCQTNNKKTD